MPKYGVTFPVVGSAYVEVEVPEGASWRDILDAASEEITSDDFGELDFVERVAEGNVLHHPQPEVDVRPLGGAPPVRRSR